MRESTVYVQRFKSAELIGNGLLTADGTLWQISASAPNAVRGCNFPKFKWRIFRNEIRQNERLRSSRQASLLWACWKP